MRDVVLSSERPKDGRPSEKRSQRNGTIASWRTDKALKIIKVSHRSDLPIRRFLRPGQKVDGKFTGKILQRGAHLRVLRGIPCSYQVRLSRQLYEVSLFPRLSRNGVIIGVRGVLAKRRDPADLAGGRVTLSQDEVVRQADAVKSFAKSSRRHSIESARRILELAHAIAQSAKLNATVRESRAAEQQQKALEAQLRAEAQERRARFLADASTILDTSFNLRETIDRLAKFILLRYADWFVLHIQVEGGFHRLSLCHRDGEKQALLEAAFPEKKAAEEEEEEEEIILDPGTFYKGRQTGSIHLFSSASPSDRVRIGQSRLRIRPLQKMSVQSMIQTPLRSHGRVIGVLTVGSDDPGHLFETGDFEMFQSLAYRISLAHESSILFDDAQQEIARRKDAEERLKAFNAELERRVRERTSLLEEATREANSFAYTVAHDLRAPLRAITGFCQALKEDYAFAMDEVGKDYLDRIVSGSRRMDDLIRDLLDYARVNRAEIRRSAVNLDEILDSVMETMVQELRERKAAVRRKGSLGTVLAHEPMLNQVITNLLSNAVKFVPPGSEPEVEIWSETQGGHLRVFFQDNGIGIAPEHQDRIFGIFERLNRTEDYPGTGIGLAIVRRAVERLGGSVGLKSEPDSGSTFWIELPTS